MTDQQPRSPIRIRRGIVAAIAGGVIALIIMFVCFQFMSKESLSDLDARSDTLLFACIFSIGAASGWASYAPEPTYSVGLTLAKIFLMTTALWFLLRSYNVPRTRLKGEFRDPTRIDELLVYAGVPLVVGAIMAEVRRRRQPNGDTRLP